MLVLVDRWMRQHIQKKMNKDYAYRRWGKKEREVERGREEK
jgi:hypothetical protein